MLTNSAKILLVIAVIGLVCSPSKPASAETDGAATYGQFNCIRHGYGDHKNCYQTFANPDNANFQTFRVNLSAEGQGYGSTSEIRITACFTQNPQPYREGDSTPNVSGLPCRTFFDNINYPDNCPDPDDNCNFWYNLVSNQVFDLGTQDYGEYNYVLIHLYVQDAGVRVNFDVSGRRVSVDLDAQPNPVVEGNQIQVNWFTQHAYNGAQLHYGGNLVEGGGVGGEVAAPIAAKLVAGL